MRRVNAVSFNMRSTTLTLASHPAQEQSGKLEETILVMRRRRRRRRRRKRRRKKKRRKS